MANATWTDRKAAVTRATYKVLQGFNLNDVCEAMVQEYVTNVECLPRQQFDAFVAEVSSQVAFRQFVRQFACGGGTTCSN